MKKNSMSRRIGARGAGEPGRGWHSSAYHRYFEGYTEYETLDDKGKPVIRRVYEGMYHIPELDKGALNRQRLGLIGLWLAAGILFGYAATRELAANSLWVAAVMQVATLGLLVWMLTALFNLCTAPVKMTIGDYRDSSLRLLHASLASLIALLLCAAYYLICALSMPGNILRHLLCAALCAAAALLMLLANRLESNVPYREEQSGEKAPREADGVNID